MIKTLCQEIIELFHQNTNDVRAIKMRKYVKDRYEFFGIPSPLRKELLRSSDLWRLKLSNQQVKEMMLILWKDPHREIQYAAMDIAIKRKKHLQSNDIDWIEQMIVTKSWWDTVDALACNLVGIILQNDRTLLEEKVNQWIHSDNIWLIRTAIIFQLKYKHDTDESLLYDNIIRHKSSKEFFINKASGWALRQHAKLYPNSVRLFVSNHPDLSNLTKREAMKHLL